MNISKVAAIVSCALVFEAGADQEFFCDAVNGNDDWDGTSATYVSGTTGPKKTIGAAVNLADGTPTVITALPGVYDEGELTDDNGGKARVVITQRNLLIRSTEGKEKTFISGRHASTANGLGDDAVRCVFIRRDREPAFASADQEATNTVIRGFTLCNGATPSGGAGAGVFCATPDAGGTAMLVDCTVSNCVGNVQAALSRCNAYRTLFVNNASVGSGNYAACMGFGVAVNCVMAFNRGNSLTYNMRKTQNCTFAFNEGDVFNGGYTVSANNCLAFGNGNNAGAGGNGYVSLKSSVMAAPSSLHAQKGSLDANTITNAGLYQCLSPATGDWRLLAGSPAIGRGQGSYLRDIILPPGETMKDFYGNPIDTSGAVDCGAVQAPAATPVGGRLVFATSFSDGTRFQIADAPAFGWRGAYHYGTSWPETCRVRFLAASPAAPLYKVYWSDGTKEVARRPGYDGYLNIVPPASEEEEQALRAVIAKGVYYVNRATGNDDWDGLSPTHEDGTTTGPKRTIQAACDVSESYSVINVAPGVYDEGMSEKVESGYFSTNRVYIGRSTCLVASDGPGTAVIKGAPDPVTGGIGQGAVRCLWVNNSECFVQGIDLVDGYTADTKDSACRGGASYMGNGGNCVLSDCMVSNCWAKEMPCMFYGNAERVRFVDCHSQGGDVFRYATLYACEVSGMSFANGGGTLFGSTSLYGCTVDLLGSTPGLSSSLAGCYFYGTIVRSTDGYVLSGNGGAANLVSADPGFADAAAHDYRLHALSPALGQADLESYGTANAKFTDPKDSPTPRLRLLSDVAGRPLRFADNAFDAGANQATPVAAYTLTLQGDPQDVILTGGAWGTHGVTETKEITVTAKIGRRPFVGIEVNGEMLPPGTSSYAFQVSPDMAASPVVRVLFGSMWYVDGTNGSDANGGGSLANALKHIRAATTNAVSGDVVLVAPGVYGEEEGAQYQTEKLDGDDSAPFNIGSRVFVPAGVTVKSLEGAAKTFIVGKTSTGDYGLGSDAVRCVKLNGSGSIISGFTITGGRTDDGANNGRADFNAGGVLGPGTAVDCVISNNAAGRCGAGFKLTAVRCRIVDNIAKSRASVGRESGFHSCYVDRNRSPEQAIQYHNVCCNTTFGPDNRNLSGGTQQPAIINVNSGGQMYNCVLNCYIGNYGKEEVRFFNCVFNKDFGYPKDLYRDENCILATTDELAFNDGRPVIGRNVCVDAGDATLEHGSYWNGLDVDGNARVQNAQMDIGACEADWKPVYARNLGGRRLKTVSAPADARSEAALHSPLHLPSGTAAFRLDATGVENADVEIDFTVTGGGTLTLVLGGETYGTYTAGTQSLRIPLSEAVTELSFTYEPGAEVAGEAVISRVRIPKGAVLIVR